MALLQQQPPVGFYFVVNFFAGGLAPNPVDIRFQRVSGLKASMSPVTLEEGGQNTFVHRLPGRFTYDNLVLERGLTIASMVNLEFQQAMTTFRFNTGNVLVTLLNESDAPVSAWLFLKTFPVSWASSDLNADENRVVIDTLELAYTRFQRINL